MVQRYQKAIAVALLLLNVSGARVVAVCDACDHNRVFFGPTLSFRAIAKTITRQKWRQPSPHSLGAQTDKYSARDLETLQRSRLVVPVAVLPPVNITLGT